MFATGPRARTVNTRNNMQYSWQSSLAVSCPMHELTMGMHCQHRHDSALTPTAAAAAAALQTFLIIIAGPMQCCCRMNGDKKLVKGKLQCRRLFTSAGLMAMLLWHKRQQQINCRKSCAQGRTDWRCSSVVVGCAYCGRLGPGPCRQQYDTSYFLLAANLGTSPGAESMHETVKGQHPTCMGVLNSFLKLGRVKACYTQLPQKLLLAVYI